MVERTCCTRPLRYDSNQPSTVPSRPYDVLSRCRSVSWSTPTGRAVSASPSCQSPEPCRYYRRVVCSNCQHRWSVSSVRCRVTTPRCKECEGSLTATVTLSAVAPLVTTTRTTTTASAAPDTAGKLSSTESLTGASFHFTRATVLM